MDILVSVSDYLFSLGISIALLVAFRVGKAIEINGIHFEEKVNDLTMEDI